MEKRNRSKNGEMMAVPRLKASNVFRDSWTRLNVRYIIHYVTV